MAVYRDDANRTAMFTAAKLVLKDGVPIVEDGEVVEWRAGRTLSLSMESDKAMERRTDTYLTERFGTGLDSFTVPDEAFDAPTFEAVPCRV